MANFGFWTLVADFGFRTLVAHNTTSSSLHCYKNCAKSVATCSLQLPIFRVVTQQG